MNHIIKKQTLLIDLPSGYDSWHLQDQLKETFNRDVLPRLAQICDEMEIDQRVTLKLDKLSIDVGSIAKEEISSLWVQETEKSFREELLRYKQERLGQDDSQNMVAPEESSLNVFMHLLEKGALPWWTSEGFNESPQNLLTKLLEEQPASLVTRIKASRYKPVISKRLFLQFEKQPVIKLLSYFEKPKFSEALSWVSELCKKEFSSELKVLQGSFLLTEIAITIDSSLAGRDNKQFFEFLFQNAQEHNADFVKPVLIKIHKHLIFNKKNRLIKKSLEDKSYRLAATKALASILNSSETNTKGEAGTAVLTSDKSVENSEDRADSQDHKVAPHAKDTSRVDFPEKPETPPSTMSDRRPSKKGAQSNEVKRSIEKEPETNSSNSNPPILKETSEPGTLEKDKTQNSPSEPGQQPKIRDQNSESFPEEAHGQNQTGNRLENSEKSVEHLSHQDQQVWEHLERIKKRQAQQESDRQAGNNNESQNLESDSQLTTENNEKNSPLEPREQEKIGTQNSENFPEEVLGQNQAGIRLENSEKSVEHLSHQDQQVWEHLERIKKRQAQQESDRQAGNNKESQNLESDSQLTTEKNEKNSPLEPREQEKIGTQNSENFPEEVLGQNQAGVRLENSEKSVEHLSDQDQRVWKHLERIKKRQAQQESDRQEGNNNESPNLESDSQLTTENNEKSSLALENEKISDQERNTHQQTRKQEALSPDQINKQRKEQQLNSLKYWQEELESIDECYIQNAGLILLWPYLGHFFKDFGLLADGDFKSQTAQRQAALVLQYLVESESELLEYKLPLNKLLCGLPISEPLSNRLSITEDDLLKCNNLLEATIQNWTALRGTSVKGFQSSFINRNGVLKTHDSHWVLQVEKMPFDMLMEQLPWPISIVRLSWMNKPIYVEW